MYEWIKALHVIAVISWMAGLLYLPRLYVYHADAEVSSKQSETFKIMERRLYRGITTPAMVLTFVFGIWMIAWGAVQSSSCRAGLPVFVARYSDVCAIAAFSPRPSR
jgi:uncharacterized integral membrane protein (TIGR00701 family)